MLARGFEIDDQFVFGRCLHRQVSRFLPLKDAIDIASRAPVLVDPITPIGDQAAVVDELALEVDRGTRLRPNRCGVDRAAIASRLRRRPSFARRVDRVGAGQEPSGRRAAKRRGLARGVQAPTTLPVQIVNVH